VVVQACRNLDFFRFRWFWCTRGDLFSTSRGMVRIRLLVMTVVWYTDITVGFSRLLQFSQGTTVRSKLDDELEDFRE